MDLAEAARRLGVTKQALLRRIWAKTLAAHKLGQKYVVLRDDIETIQVDRASRAARRAWDHLPENIQ
jgi:excisionase family DNA binding protein